MCPMDYTFTEPWRRILISLFSMVTRVDGRAFFLSPSRMIRSVSEENSDKMAAVVSRTGWPLRFTLVLKIGAPHSVITLRSHSSPGQRKAIVGRAACSASGESFLM